MLPVEKRLELLKVIAHPVRIKILEDLMQGVKCVSDFEESLDISQPIRLAAPQASSVARHRRLFHRRQAQMLLSQGAAYPDLLELLKKEYDDDISAPTCCPVTKKGTYPGERRR